MRKDRLNETIQVTITSWFYHH